MTTPSCPKCSQHMQRAGANRSGSVRWRCRSGGSYCAGLTTTQEGEVIAAAGSGKEKPRKQPRFFRPIGRDTKRFIITTAQNSTPVHDEFFATLKVAAAHLGAELIVIPIRYKNPTSRWTASQKNEEWWAKEVEPFLYNARKKLNDNLVLVGDVKAQPTAAHPLTGFEGLTGSESCIIGHTKLQLKVVAVPAGRFPKILTTTGACTKANYTDSKAGKLGEFHHTLGAALVEVDGKKFHLRQLIWSAKDNGFVDLDKMYTPAGVKKAPPALGLVMGDTHYRFSDPKVLEATFGKAGIVETLNPETLVWHDLFDGYSTNPHHINNPFASIAKARARFGNVEDEVANTVKFVDEKTGARRSIVAASNHDNFLSRWVQYADWKHSPTNARFYLETALMMVQSTKMGPGGFEYADPLKHWVSALSKNPRVRCLDTDESYLIAGIECGMHGHNGPDGSRGNIKNLARLGPKTIIGHRHTPGIHEGCYQVGTSTPLRLEYCSGPSSWLNTHAVIYSTGKRSLITIIDGDWKL